MDDKLILGGREFSSRLIMGSGKFDHAMIDACVRYAGCEIVTLALRRVNESKSRNILDFIPRGVTLLPNTSGARNAEEALRIARLARELGCGDFVKIEIIGDSKYLLPDNAETIKACEALAREDFVPLAYMHADLCVARDLVSAGVAAVMPLAAPIGSNRGLMMRGMIEILLGEIDVPIIVDAGLGAPSEACEAMQMGCAAVMVNTAIATSWDLALMARAFALGVQAGRDAYLAGLGAVCKTARASSPLTGFLR